MTAVEDRAAAATPAVPGRPSRRRRRPLVIGLVVALTAGAVTGGALVSQSFVREALPLRPDGIALGPDSEVVALPIGAGATYVPGTSFLTGSDPDPAAVAESRAWLAAGTVPGTSDLERELAERALLDLRLVTDDSGATVAGWRTAWQYVWPRDAGFAVAAFAATGHLDEAEEVLGFLARVADGTGTWQARYLPDGSGLAPDCRVEQFDGAGWVPWAVWTWYVAASAEGPAPELAPFWSLVRHSADAIVADMGEDGLPSPSSDYIEHPEADLTLGTAAPLLVGLRSAADLAHRTGRTEQAERWDAAAQLLDAALTRHFGGVGYARRLTGGKAEDQWREGPHGYPQAPRETGEADSAVTFLVPPFAPVAADRAEAVAATRRTLTLPSGGIKPIEQWRSDGVAWTPETALFALAAAGLGEPDRARGLLQWLADHRTSSGAIPEQVAPDGEPRSVAPLAWTEAIVLLTLVQLERGLPVPPVRGPAVEAPDALVEPQDVTEEPDDERGCRR